MNMNVFSFKNLKDQGARSDIIKQKAYDIDCFLFHKNLISYFYRINIFHKISFLVIRQLVFTMSFVQQRTNKNKKDSSEREDIDSSDDKLHSIIECRKNQPSIISNPYKKKSSNKVVVIDYSSLVTPAHRIRQEAIDLAVVAAN